MCAWDCVKWADTGAVISVARSFGLSTTTGARGDAVSYVLRLPGALSDSSPAASAAHPSQTELLGVVKVIKSKSVFQQELSALSLIQSLLPSPQRAFYPRMIAADWALIPTAIPKAPGSSTNSNLSAFSRPYSVSSMGSSVAPSSSSTDNVSDSSYCRGGLVLMQCAPGVAVAELFSRITAFPLGSADRKAKMQEMAVALREAARALAELHLRTSVSGASPDAAWPFLENMRTQMQDMLGKLALPEYSETINKWNLDVKFIGQRMEEMLQAAKKHPGGM
jgi:hypothetical protein